MEVFVSGIPDDVNQDDFHESMKRLLHPPGVISRYWTHGWLMNFSTSLHSRSQHRPWRTGTVSVPNLTIANALIGLDWMVHLRQWSLRFRLSRDTLPASIAEILQTPYEHPTVLQERIQIEKRLSGSERISRIEFGWIDRDGVFSGEWTRNYTERHSSVIHFNSYLRAIHIEEVHGDKRPRKAYVARRITILFSIIERLGLPPAGHTTGNEPSQPCLLLNLRLPPIYEELRRPQSSGTAASGDTEKWVRRSCLHDSGQTHRRIAPLTSLAIMIYFPNRDGLESVLAKTRAVPLPSPHPIPVPVQRGHFSVPRMTRASNVITSFSETNWPVAFQLSCFIRQHVVSAKELLALEGLVTVIGGQITSAYPQEAADILIEFKDRLSKLQTSSFLDKTEDFITEAVKRCFLEACHGHSYRLRLPRQQGDFILCYHARVTPTSIVPDGPYHDQSNRVLRWYPTHNHCFLRVTFCDEDKLQFRWDKDVDGEEFVSTRIGLILKEGLRLAGKHFKFLAYSNSALKQHTVWFVADFLDDNHQRIDADLIRYKLGNFDRVIRSPARYGARMSQAFTATRRSISIEATEVLPQPDIETFDPLNGRIVFTDGVGACSRATMDAIANALENAALGKVRRRNYSHFSAVQIRLAGYKGVLAVDHGMGGDGGHTVVLRDSMNKFHYHAESLEIEIAEAFDHARSMYLNRPLIMALESLGVPISAFTTLQSEVVTSVRNSTQSIHGAAQLMTNYGLGASFRIPSLLLALDKRGADASILNDPFISRSLNLTVNDVLRDLKHKARILVPRSWTLVGIADIHGYLEEGKVFVCICDDKGNKEYLNGDVLLARSPVAQPGDVQMATAIGPPPPNSPFMHEDFPNCVVFATRGARSLPHSLGGGDLDGDLYNVIQHEDLFPEFTVLPASYPPAQIKELPIGQQVRIDDICDFIVDFINNDHIGLIASTVRHMEAPLSLITNLLLKILEVADESNQMLFDPRCLALAEQHNVAVDFQKSGTAADLKKMPRRLPQRPDWAVGEVTSTGAGRKVYRSQRALGVLYRNIELPDTHVSSPPQHSEPTIEDLLGRLSLDDQELLQDEISVKITGEVEAIIPVDVAPQLLDETILPLFHTFSRHLARICTSYTIGRQPLTEEECWAGTIVAKSSQQGRRADMQARMREQCSILSTMMRAALSGEDKEDTAEEWLTRAWAAWVTSRKLEDRFGAKLYGWIALGSIFDALKRIQEREQE